MHVPVKQELVSGVVAMPLFVLLFTIGSIPPSIAQPEQRQSVYSYVTQWGSEGPGSGQFNGQNDVDPFQDNVFVADYDNNRIQIFGSNGTFVTSWGSEGSGEGQFMGPAGLAVDSDNNIYVTDRDNDRVQVFTNNGTFITSFGSQGSGDGQFNRPEGIGVDPYSETGIVYVADTGNTRIQAFKLEK